MKTLETKNAPAAIGPYSQAKMVGNFVFASGQIPVDPATGEFLKRPDLHLIMLSRLPASLQIWQISLHSMLYTKNTSQANRLVPALL